jgi:hypothetical protein
MTLHKEKERINWKWTSLRKRVNNKIHNSDAAMYVMDK